MMETKQIEFIRIEKLKFKDVEKVLKMYSESSKDLKQKFLNPGVLTSKLGLLHLYLSATPLKQFLLCQITSLVAKRGDEIVGFVYINKHRKNKKDLGIVVKEGYQGKKIGDRLMSAILKNQDEVCISVLNDNEKAIKLYEKHGFKTEYVFRMMKWENSANKDENT